jgi:tetratricopeptide (TPR) repeat protein
MMHRVITSLLLAVLICGCRSKPREDGAPGSAGATGAAAQRQSDIPDPTLPDLSRAERSVQQQIEGSQRSLQSRLANHATPATDVARAYGDTGTLLLAADYADAAEPYYLHAEALQPGEIRWPYYLGHVYMAKAEPEKAIAAFERALRIRPNDVATLVWLGTVQLNQGRADVAEARFEQALSSQSNAVAALAGAGQAALARRDYTRAVQRFEQALAADPRASSVHYPLALAYRALGNTAQADAHLRQQGKTEVGPPDPLMVELRGALHGAAAAESRGERALESGDIATAVTLLRAAVDLAPDNPSPRHKLGTALSLMGDTAGAIAQFEETLRRSPHYSQAHYSLGVLLAASGRDREAIGHLSAAVREDPSYLEARLQLAQTYGRSGQLDTALAEYRRALAAEPRSADARFGCAMALIALRRYDDARTMLSEGARLHPDQPRFAEMLTKLQAAAR